MNSQEKLHNTLANGDTDIVLAAMKYIFEGKGDSMLLSQAVLLNNRLNQIKTQERLGTLNGGEIRIVKNQINLAVFELISQVPNDAQLPDFFPELAPANTKNLPPLLTDNNQLYSERQPKIPLAIGIFLILLTAFFVFQFPCPSVSIAWWIRLMSAAGIAAFVYYMSGTIEASLSQGIKGTGSLILLVILYLLNPIGGILGQDCILEVPVTVFVLDEKEDLALRQKGHVLMDYRGERKRKEIGENGEAFFSNLSIGEKVRLSIDFSEPYKPLRPDSLYTIDKTGKIYLHVTLQHLDRIFGKVLFKDQPLPDVTIAIGTALRDTTDALGYYDLTIPLAFQRKEQEVMFYKKGFKTLTKRAYPQTNDPLNVVMEK